MKSPLSFPLLVNAAFSASTGAASIAFAAELPQILGLGFSGLYIVLGSSLLSYALALCFVVRRSDTWLTLLACVADTAWIVVATTVGVIYYSTLPTAGAYTIALTTCAVAAILWLQLRGLDLAFARSVHGEFELTIKVDSTATPESLWRVVRELGEIHKYMPSLQSSTILENARPGVGAIRRCIDKRGACWSERCDTWEEGRAFSVTFNTEDPTFPFPFSKMRGGWFVEPTGRTCTVHVWWHVVPKHQAFVGLLLAVMARRASLDFQKIVGRMTEAASLQAQ